MSEFVEVKVGELSGAALDWAVAQAVGVTVGYFDDSVFRADGDSHAEYHPSWDQSICNELIEKFKVRIENVDRDGDRLTWLAGAPCQESPCGYAFETGNTIPVAVCRAIVSAKLGDVVQVPVELVGVAA